MAVFVHGRPFFWKIRKCRGIHQKLGKLSGGNLVNIVNFTFGATPVYVFQKQTTTSIIYYIFTKYDNVQILADGTCRCVKI